MSDHARRELSSDERAELEGLRDLRARVIGFGGDDYAIQPWVAAHKLHKDEPYIGCLFCRPEFVPRSAVARYEDVLERIAAGACDGIDDEERDEDQPCPRCLADDVLHEVRHGA